MSLCVKLFGQSRELFVDSMWHKEEETKIVICPSPKEADQLRKLLINAKNTDVITISKFISNLLAQIEAAPSYTRKSDLMLKLSVFWKQVFPEKTFEQFSQSFTLLTEMRGTSTQLETLQEVIDQYHPDVASGITMLWRSMEASEFFDEHAIYQYLTDIFRQTASPLTDSEQVKTYCIYGFSHLSGLQVDLLKAMALREKVIVPYREELFNLRHSSDWISWLTTEEMETKVNPPLPQMNFDLYSFAKNRMSETLKVLIEGQDDVQILLGASDPELADYLEIPSQKFFFKAKLDLVSDSFSKVEEKIRLAFAASTNQTVLSEDIEALLQTQFDEAVKTQDFRLLKATTLVQETVSLWHSLASVNNQMTTFDWEVIRQSSRLNSPRLYFSPDQSSAQQVGIIKAFKEMQDLDKTKTTYICLSSNHAAPKLGESEYSHEVARLLMNLGPRRRKEIDFLKLRAEFREIIQDANPIFVIEKDLLEHDLGWAEMLSGLHFNSQKVELKSIASRKDLLNKSDYSPQPPFETISPSRLQTYVECPRQYYYQYIEKVSETPQLESDLEARFLGEIEHDVIAKYLETNKDWNEKKHQDICDLLIDKTLIKNKIILNETTRAKHRNEIIHYSRRGIYFVQTLMQQLPDAKLEFERPYMDGEFKGRVDLIIKSGIGHGVLDFKRSAASVPNNKQHINFEKIQMWNYLSHACKQENKELLFWGYVCLKEIEQSLLYSTWPELSLISHDSFESDVSFIQVDVTSLQQQLADYNEFESTTLVNLKKEQHWRALPQSSGSCTFCAVNTLCSRGLV